MSTEMDGGAAMYHEEVTTVAGNHVQRTIKGVGPDCEDVDPVTRNSRVVADYEREIAEKRRISAYQNRPIHSIFKTDSQRAAARKRRATPTISHD